MNAYSSLCLRAAKPFTAPPKPLRPFVAAALAAIALLVVEVRGASAQDERFQAWLLGFSSTYTLEVHVDVDAKKYKLPEIPLCPVGRCADIFTDGGNYNFAMRFEVPNGGKGTAKNTKITVSLFRVNLITGEVTRLHSLRKKVKNLSAEKSVDLDIAGITNDEQLVAIVKAKRGLLEAGVKIEMTVALTFNDPR